MEPIIFDTETTGVDHEKDQIIEEAYIVLPDTPAGFLQVRSRLMFQHHHQRYRPTVPISIGAQAVHHIICSDLIGCPDAGAYQPPMQHALWIGHNIDFDWRMAGEPEVKRICTLALSRFLFPDKDSHTQSAMLYLIGRRNGKEAEVRELLRNAHAALDDVRNCSLLLRFLLQQAAEQGHAVDTWAQVLELSDTARIPTVMGFGKHKGTPIILGQLDPGYVRWYRGQVETDPFYLAAFDRAGF